MKLNELTREYDIDPNIVKTTKDFYQRADKWNYDNPILDLKLEKLGWQRNYLSKGSYSMIYENPQEPRYIIKINQRRDSGFEWFAFLTKKFPNIHFPKIGNAKIITVDKTKYFVYAIEKLFKFEEAVDITNIAQLCDHLIDSSGVGVSAIKNLNTKDLVTYIEEYPKQFDYPARIVESFLFLLENYPSFESQFNTLINACNILAKNQRSFFNDIHDGNIMRRQDGTIVISDPFSGADSWRRKEA